MFTRQEIAHCCLCATLSAVSSQERSDLPDQRVFCDRSEANKTAQAMELLPIMASYTNIELAKCGLLFLATPHLGSKRADWPKAMLAAAEAIGGVRREWVDVLKSFNNDALWDRLKFFKLKPCPPFQCFAEGEMTYINLLQKKRVS